MFSQGSVKLLCTCMRRSYVNVALCPAVSFEALGSVHVAWVCAPLHLAVFVHASAPVHEWN